MEINQYPLRIEITNKCNLKCDYCLSLTSDYYRNRPETNFEALAKFIKDLNIRSLFLMGGEVCFYYKIHELAEFCLRNKVSLGIVTNGTILDRYKTLSKINKNIKYLVSYNKEGCPDRLKLCNRFIKEMKVNAVNILINKENRNIVIKQIEKFHRMRRIKLIKIFSDERTKKGEHTSLFEYLVSKYSKVYVHDYSLAKGSFEKIDDTQGYKIKCNNPFSLKGNNISFCKNIEDFGMDITKVDFSQKLNKEKLKREFNDFQAKMNKGLVEGCQRCRFKNYITKEDKMLEWVTQTLNRRCEARIQNK